MSNLIMIPFAYLYGYAPGANVSTNIDSVNLYLKNACVALISAKIANPNDDVALVTNLKNIELEYRQLLDKFDVKIINVPFDEFLFDNSQKWSISFYRLCVLKYVSRNLNYNCICYLDSDTYSQHSFDHIWEECEQNILMFDISHGLQVHDYEDFVSSVVNFDKTLGFITQYGGEFYASSSSHLKIYIEECEKIYKKMKETNYQTRFGDEFLISIAASDLKSIVKNASPYVYRYWTRSFRLISTNYKFNPVCILHCPDEKRDGFIKLYNYLHKHGQFPSYKKILYNLHISHFPIRYKITGIFRK